MGLSYVPVISQNANVTFNNSTVNGTETVAGGLSVTGGNLNVTNTANIGFGAMTSGQTSGNFTVFSGSANALRLGTVGGGIAIKAGANATVGTATLTAGTVTVSTTKVSATSVIFVTIQALGTVTTAKSMTIANKTAATSFQIVSEDATDTSTVAWWILETV